MAYQATGNSGAALAFAYVEAEKHSDPSRWRAAARSYQAGGAWTAALDAWLEVLALVPDDAEAHLQAGVILAPHDARRAYRHFVEVQNAPDFEPAARSLQAAIEESQLGDPSRQLSAIGTALASMHYWSQAEEALSMAVTLDAGFAEAWAYLGMVRAQQDKDGTGACARAIAIQPDGPLTNYLCGLMWRAQGEISRSVAALSLAQSLAPGNPAFAAELGAAFQLVSDFPEAEKWFEMAAAMAPADPNFGELLALFYADTLYELDGKALPTVQSAVDGQPADAELAAALGWVLFNLGDAEAASDAVNTALMLDPRSARALYYRGVISQAQGQGELAVNALVELLNHPEPRGFDVLARRVLDRMGYR